MAVRKALRTSLVIFHHKEHDREAHNLPTMKEQVATCNDGCYNPAILLCQKCKGGVKRCEVHLSSIIFLSAKLFLVLTKAY